jgi:hypothetical protein
MITSESQGQSAEGPVIASAFALLLAQGRARSDISRLVQPPELDQLKIVIHEPADGLAKGIH